MPVDNSDLVDPDRLKVDFSYDNFDYKVLSGDPRDLSRTFGTKFSRNKKAF